jgi:hypothetical protein
VADTIARMGVSAFSASPGGISVRVSTAKGQSSLPPTHQGGGGVSGLERDKRSEVELRTKEQQDKHQDSHEIPPFLIDCYAVPKIAELSLSRWR